MDGPVLMKTPLVYTFFPSSTLIHLFSGLFSCRFILCLL